MKKLFSKVEIVTAIDIENDLIKLAQARIANGKKSLHRLLAVKSPSSNPSDLVKTIHNLASQLKLFKSLVLVNLPRHMVTIKEIKLPSVSLEELEDMIDLQVANLIPYPKEEIIYSYKVTETSDEGFSRVMLVLTHRDVITKLLQIFTQAGLDIQKIALSSESISFWYISNQTEQNKTLPVALIDIDSSSADIQIILNGRLEFTRAVTFLPETQPDRLVDEISRSFLNYKKESKPDISKIVLSGAESLISKIAGLLKKEFAVPTVYIDSVGTWPVTGKVFLPPDEEKKKTSFSAVLSLAFNFDRLQLNLLPSNIREVRAARLIKETIFVTALLSLCVLLGIGGVILKKLGDKNDYLRYVNKEIKNMTPQVRELNNMLTNINIIKRQLDMSGTGIDIIRELYSLIPPDISLAILDFEEGVSCVLRGTANELSDVFKFVTILEKSTYFKNVSVRYATKRTVKKQILTDFEIVGGLAEDPEAGQR